MALHKVQTQSGGNTDDLATNSDYLSAYQTAHEALSSPYEMTKILPSNDYRRTQATQVNLGSLPDPFVPGEGNAPTPGVSGDDLGDPEQRSQNFSSMRQQRGDEEPERLTV